jgi:hypothetical protein
MVVTVNFSLNEIKDEALHLVETGKVDPHQSICVLCDFIPPKEPNYEIRYKDY